MKTIILIRHCETTGQAPDAPLTPRGYQQAQLLADTLGNYTIERIIASPYLRAQESIRPLAERLKLPINPESRLIERVLAGESREDWREQLALSFDDLDRVLPGGESSRVAMQRGVAVVEELLAQFQENTVVVTHGNLLALILKHFNPSLGFAAWESLTAPDIYTLQIDQGVPLIQRLSITP